MGHSVPQTALTRIDRHAPGPVPAVGTNMALRLELPTTTDSATAMERMVSAALSTVGARAPTVQALVAAAHAACQHIRLHTAAPFYQLILNAQADGISLAVTDYVPPVFPAQPIWHPAPSPAAPHSTGAEDTAAGTLQLHHSTDGHTQLTAHSPWTNSGR